jgi:hypothetical protein
MDRVQHTLLHRLPFLGGREEHGGDSEPLPTLEPLVAGGS